MHSRATDRRSASKCQGKWPDQTLDQAFGLPEVVVAVSTSRLSCKRAGKTRTLMPVWDSSGESRMKKLLLAGASICALTAMTHLARAGDLQAYRKPVCETAEDYAGCMANKKPQMWATDGIKWDCRHGFSLTDESGDMGDEVIVSSRRLISSASDSATLAFLRWPYASGSPYSRT